MQPQQLANIIQAKRKQYGLKHWVSSTIHSAMGDTISKMATEIFRPHPNYRMWDKGKMVIILSRTKRAKDTIFVGDQTETIKELTDFLTWRSKWTDYIESILSIITINDKQNRPTPEQSKNQPYLSQYTFPYRICDNELPQCNTGYVYFLISIRSMIFSYIGKTNSIRQRLRQHNSGIGQQQNQHICNHMVHCLHT